MQHEPPDFDDASAQYHSVYTDSVLGYGGVVLGADGIPRPMPEHEALAGAIAHWVQVADHEADALGACLEFATHDHPTVRAAAVAAFGDLVRRYGRLGERDRVVRAIERGLRDGDNDVSSVATRSADVIE